MNNTKHTPGPLTVSASAFRGKDDNQYTIVSNYSNRPEGVDFMDAYVNFSGYYGTYGPHVFAAAPNLLSALEMAMDSLQFAICELKAQASIPQEDAEMMLARYESGLAAIAKAKGQTT